MTHRSVVHATGFILKKRAGRENDQIITLFSKELGKITCIAKGAQKISGRRIGVLDSLNMVRLVLSLHHGFYYVKQADLVSRLEDVKQNFEKRTHLLLVAEVLEKLLPLNEIEENVFSFFKHFLVGLNKKQFNQQDIALYLKEFARMLGYVPQNNKITPFSLPQFVHALTEREVVSFKLN